MTDALNTTPPQTGPRDSAGNALDSANRPAQLTRADLRSMTSAEIQAARLAGKFADLMAGKS